MGKLSKSKIKMSILCTWMVKVPILRCSMFGIRSPGKNCAVPQAELNSDIDQKTRSPETDEWNYLDQVALVLKNGIKKEDRTGTGTKSIFGTQARYSLRDNIFPLLTTKKLFHRGIIEELLWFIRGSTNAKVIIIINDRFMQDG